MDEKSNKKEAIKPNKKEVVKPRKKEVGKDNEQKHLRSLLRHIKGVQDACLLLGEKLIENGEEEFGRILVCNGLSHDNSKLVGIEWESLVRNEDNGLLKIAIRQHWTANPHHPEYWGDIREMPRIYLAEMVCDCYGRSNEFGTNLREWFKEDAVKRYGYSLKSKVYQQIKSFVDILIEPAFKPI